MRRWTGESVADGRYAIGDVLGRGRDVRVYRAEDTVLRRSVAVKFYSATAGGRTPARWRTEAAALDRIDHHHVVRLLDGGETPDSAFLVLPLLPGTLASRLDDGPMTRPEAARVVLALADALGRVHRAGLVHGDVDVDGVLIDELGLPCWSGLPDPIAATHDRATERDLAGLAALAVRCVTRDATPTTAPSAVLDVIRVAAAAPSTPDLHDRLTSVLISAVPARRYLRTAPFVTAARRRARPGFAAVLGLGFAASVIAGLVVDTGTWRATIGDGLQNTPGALVLSDGPAPQDIATSVRDALGSLPDGSTTMPAGPARAAPGASDSARAVVDDPTTDSTVGPAGAADDSSSRAGDRDAGPGYTTTRDEGAHREGDAVRDGGWTGASGDRDGRSDDQDATGGTGDAAGGSDGDKSDGDGGDTPDADGRDGGHPDDGDHADRARDNDDGGDRGRDGGSGDPDDDDVRAEGGLDDGNAAGDQDGVDRGSGEHRGGVLSRTLGDLA